MQERERNCNDRASKRKDKGKGRRVSLDTRTVVSHYHHTGFMADNWKAERDGKYKIQERNRRDMPKLRKQMDGIIYQHNKG